MLISTNYSVDFKASNFEYKLDRYYLATIINELFSLNIQPSKTTGIFKKFRYLFPNIKTVYLYSTPDNFYVIHKIITQ